MKGAGIIAIAIGLIVIAGAIGLSVAALNVEPTISTKTETIPNDQFPK